MKKQKKPSTKNENREKEPERTINTGHDKKEPHSDKSYIDRWEGNMNNGELGGSLGQKREDE